jgi:hypothetical protein
VKYLLHYLALVSRRVWLLMKLGLIARVSREAACGRHLKQLLVPSALVPGVGCDRRVTLSAAVVACMCVCGFFCWRFSAFLCDLGALSPAAALREVLFSPQLDISTELRDSSRVLGDLIEFALRRLHALSSSTVKQAGYKALQLALGVEPFSLERHISAARSAAEATAGYRRTVTRVVSPTAREGSKDGHAADFGLDTSVAAALSTVVSPKNVDVVITIEQELALLDEGQEAEGVAGVGDRMDQVCAACDNVYTKVFTLCCISCPGRRRTK